MCHIPGLSGQVCATYLAFGQVCGHKWPPSVATYAHNCGLSGHNCEAKVLTLRVRTFAQDLVRFELRKCGGVFGPFRAKYPSIGLIFPSEKSALFNVKLCELCKWCEWCGYLRWLNAVQMLVCSLCICSLCICRWYVAAFVAAFRATCGVCSW